MPGPGRSCRWVRGKAGRAEQAPALTTCTAVNWHRGTRRGPATGALCSLLVTESSGCEEDVDHLINVVLLLNW